MAYRAGTAFITVTPSFKGFQLAAAAEAKKLRAIKIPVKYDMPDLPPVAPGKPVKIKAELDEGSFERNVKAKLRAALASIPKDIGLNADASEAEREIASLRTQLESLSKQRIGIDVSADQALTEVAYVRRELERLGADSPNVQVRADAAAAATELEAVQAIVEKLDHSRPTINADADTAAAETKLLALDGLVGRLNGRSILIKAAISALPMAGPLGAVLAGGAGGIGAIGAGLAAGVAGGAAIGAASIGRALGLQKQLTQATKSHVTALASVKSAEGSLASAEASAANAQISAARGIADAQRGVGDARRNAARVAVTSERQVKRAEDQLKASQDRVTASLKDLHDAREQAKRDLEDLKERTGDNARTVEGASIGLIEAQQNLAAVEKTSAEGSLALRKARLDVADAEDALSDAKRQQAQDTKALTKAEKDGIDKSTGVTAAKAQLTQARKDAAQARTEVREARSDAAAARADAARGVAVAEQNLTRARVDGARQVSQAQAEVARASDRVAVAQAALDKVDSKRAGLLAAMTPLQEKLLKGLKGLKTEWNGFLTDVEKPVDSAIFSGLTAIEKALPGLALFIRPVARGLGDVFKIFGDAAGTKGARDFAHTMGVFSGGIVRDAGRGTLNLARGFGNLFKAFMPLGTDMSKGLVVLTGRFAKWSDGIEKSKGFRGFITYVRKEGPVVLSVLGSFVEFTGKIFRGLAPLGELMLGGLMLGLKFLAHMDTGQLMAVAGGIGAIGLAIALATGGTTLLVPLLIGLGGGLAYAFKHSKPFHDIVMSLSGWLQKNLLPALKDGANVVLPAIQRAFRKVNSALGDNHRLFHDLGTILGIVGGFITKVYIPVLARVYAYMIGKFASGISKGIRVLGWLDDAFHSGVDAGRAIVRWFNGSFLPFFTKTLPDKFRDVFGKGGTIRSLFSSAVDAIGDIWGGLKAKAAKPVNFIIGTVYNDGLRKAINLIPGVKDLKPAKLIKYADGGVMPGYTPGRDVHKFYSPTAGHLELSGGEPVMRPEFGRAVGDGWVHKMNSLARNGGADAVRRAMGMHHFASGGIFRPVRGGSPGGVHDQSTGFPAVDVAVPVGSQVASVAAGRVVKSYDIHGYEPRRRGPQDGYRSYGRMIQVLHNGFSTLYAHLSKRGVGAGAHVAGGQIIGLSGNTGNTTGPHLHFGARGRSPLSFFGGSTAFSNIGSAAGFGAGAINSYGGPSLGSVLSHLNPKAWKSKLDKMGGFGPTLSGMVGGITSTVKHLASKKIHAAIKAAGSFIGSGLGAVGNLITGKGGSPRAIARGMLGNYGWGAGQFAPLNALWNRESGWNPRADNPTSSAYGIPQALPGSKMASAGADWRTNPTTQIRWGLGYIKGRYGNPAGAWAHSQATGWYKNGGIIPSFDNGGYIPPGVSTVFNGTRKPERVLTDQQWNDLRKVASSQPSNGDQRPIHVYDRSGSPQETARLTAREIAWAGRG